MLFLCTLKGMERKKPKRTTVQFNLQIDPKVADAARDFAEARGEKLRDMVELALKRHMANPPPTLDIPPLPPMTFSESAPARRRKAKE